VASCFSRGLTVCAAIGRTQYAWRNARRCVRPLTKLPAWAGAGHRVAKRHDLPQRRRHRRRARRLDAAAALACLGSPEITIKDTKSACRSCAAQMAPYWGLEKSRRLRLATSARPWPQCSSRPGWESGTTRAMIEDQDQARSFKPHCASTTARKSRGFHEPSQPGFA